jgi:hypothetical protein
MMKKALLVVLLGLSIGFCGMLYAQSNKSQRKDSEYYYVSVPIEKIYAYRKGYVVAYRKGVNGMARTYIPMEWFSGLDGKADLIVQGSGKAWPTLTVYYKAGQFSHIRLYVRQNRSHESWGVVPLNINIDEYFEGVEEIKLEF